MPYPNEHAARLLNPNNFVPDSFKRKNIAQGIDVILGRLKSNSKFLIQTYRFKKDTFTASQAKAWLKNHKIHYVNFESATS